MAKIGELWAAKYAKQILIHGRHCIPSSCSWHHLIQTHSSSGPVPLPEVTTLPTPPILITLASDAPFSQMTLLNTMLLSSPWFTGQWEGWVCAGWPLLLPGGHSAISPPLKSTHSSWHPKYFSVSSVAPALGSEVSSPYCLLTPFFHSWSYPHPMWISSDSFPPVWKCLCHCLKKTCSASVPRAVWSSRLFRHLCYQLLSSHTWLGSLNKLPVHLQVLGQLAWCLMGNFSRLLLVASPFSAEALLFASPLCTPTWLPSQHTLPGSVPLTALALSLQPPVT